jgi:hypothetical protein
MLFCNSRNFGSEAVLLNNYDGETRFRPYKPLLYSLPLTTENMFLKGQLGFHFSIHILNKSKLHFSIIFEVFFSFCNQIYETITDTI